MSVSAEDLLHVVRVIWSTQLQLELEEAEIELFEPTLDRSEDIVAYKVEFSGDFNGTLLLRGTRQLAIAAASAAFATNGDDLGASDARDAFAELANMTAGNVKSLFPGENELGIPSAAEGDEIPGTTLAEVALRLGGEPLIVRLYQR